MPWATQKELMEYTAGGTSEKRRAWNVFVRAGLFAGASALSSGKQTLGAAAVVVLRPADFLASAAALCFPDRAMGRALMRLRQARYGSTKSYPRIVLRNCLELRSTYKSEQLVHGPVVEYLPFFQESAFYYLVLTRLNELFGGRVSSVLQVEVASSLCSEHPPPHLRPRFAPVGCLWGSGERLVD